MSDEICRIQYTGDGITKEFSYPFKIFALHNLQVYVAGRLLASGWRINKIGEGGKVIFDEAPDAGTLITLLRHVEVKRISDFQEGGLIKAEVLNREFDYRVAVEAQLADSITRVMSYSATAPAGLDATLPHPTPKKALVWADDGLKLVNSETNIDEIAGEVTSKIAGLQNIEQKIEEKVAIIEAQAQSTQAMFNEIEGLATGIEAQVNDKLNSDLSNLSNDGAAVFAAKADVGLSNLSAAGEAKFAAKAERDGNNMSSNIDFVVESWVADNGTSWYRKYRSGWVEQGGHIGNASSVTFPVVMRDTNYSLTSTFAKQGNSNVGKTGHWLGVTKTTTGATRTYNTLKIDWEVKGYAAA